MRRILVGAALGALLVGGAMSAASARDYHLDVSVLALDGSVTAHQRFTCKMFEACQNFMTAKIDGKPIKFGVRASMPNDAHHVRVILQGGGRNGGAFNNVIDDKAFEPGNEWMATLHEAVETPLVKKPGQKPWEWSGGVEDKAIGKVRFKIEN